MKSLGDFVTMIKSFQTMLATHSAYALGEHIARSSGILKDLFTDKTPEGISRYENIQELLNAHEGVQRRRMKVPMSRARCRIS